MHRRFSAAKPAREGAPRISAVVPTLDEEAEIAACLNGLREAGADEIIVIDGGSGDRTREEATPWADRVLSAPRGLFSQLNTGAEAASGDVLLFHYADTRLEAGALFAVRTLLEDRDVGGGAFCLAFASRRLVYRLIALGANARNRLGLGPFGDQSLFLRAPLFHAIGGFEVANPWADLALVRALRREARFRIIAPCVQSSARRWEERGIARTIAAHLRLSAACVLGVKSARMASAVDDLRTVREESREEGVEEREPA